MSYQSNRPQNAFYSIRRVIYAIELISVHFVNHSSGQIESGIG